MQLGKIGSSISSQLKGKFTPGLEYQWLVAKMLVELSGGRSAVCSAIAIIISPGSRVKLSQLNKLKDDQTT